jgi:phosphotriesterase-related protein
MRIVKGGSYLGFDRFGLDVIHPDDERVKSLLRLLEAGVASQIVVSHDSVWCWRGMPIPSAEILAAMESVWKPTHFVEKIVPRLLDGGATQAHIDALLVENPRRFFAGAVLPG